MKKLSIFSILVLMGFFIFFFVHADFSQPLYSDECKNSEQNDFVHYFCWSGQQAFDTTTPPSSLPASGILNTITLKLHSRTVNSGVSSFATGPAYYENMSGHVCYLPGFFIPNDGNWHDITFLVADSLDWSTGGYYVLANSPSCVLDFSNNRLQVISISTTAVDSAWSDHSVYSDPVDTQINTNFGIPSDRSLYFIINNSQFQFTSPTNNQTISSSTFNVTGTCPTNGTQQLAVVTQSFASGTFPPLYNVDCNGNTFSASLNLTTTDNTIYAIDKSSGSIISVPVNTSSIENTKTPILIIPGTLGTEIDKGSEILWPNMTELTNKFPASDSFMDPLAFNLDGTPLDTSLTLGPVLGVPDPRFDYSNALVTDLTSEGYATGTNLLLFPYDWRDDIDKVAENFLKPEIDSIVSSSPNGKIDIIAHSQGGLLLKRLLYDHPEYESKINKIIFVGTPNLGAPKAAKVLLYGDSFDIHKLWIGLNPLEMQKISQNMPSVYQLLPSAEYFNHSSGYLGALDPSISLIGGANYNFSQTEQALKDLGENASLIDQATTFHSSDYDNMDFTNSGIQTYNIMGCQSGTLGQILVGSDGQHHLNYWAGDGTVPIISASNIYGTQNYYSLDTGDIHGTMLTTDGIRQQIENIITGSSLPTNNITQDPSECHYNGEQVSVHSPVDLEIYDENGDHVGPNPDGSFDYNIDGVQYDTIGHEKFAFLPLGHTYKIELPAISAGSFSFDSSKISEGNVVSTAYYDGIPITANSTAQVNLNSANNQTILLDSNGDGTNDATIVPSSILNPSQSQDLTPPVSTSTISGTMGQPGFYRSNATITLSATDPIVNNDPTQTSGLLKIQYSLDSSATTTYQSPISVTSEGNHTITFFSTDNAGNNEQPQTVNFTIDKTAPEFFIQFSPSLQDLVFTATDTLPTVLASTSTAVKIKPRPPVKVVDADDVITATDAAGNTAQINLADKNRKKNMKAQVQSLLYNGVVQDISATTLKFSWALDKSGNVTALEQHIKSKKNFNIDAVYSGGQTQLSGKDQGGKVSATSVGLTLLQVFTNTGDFGWED